MTTDHNIIGGRPLMIWGGGGGNFLNEFFFPRNPFCEYFFFQGGPSNFFPGECPSKKIFLGEWPSKFFFLEKGLRKFFFSISYAAPQTINGRPLNCPGTSTSSRMCHILIFFFSYQSYQERLNLANLEPQL